MKLIQLPVAILAGIAAASPTSRHLVRRNTTEVGTGPYPAGYFTDPTLATHTIYMPLSPPSGVSLPVLVWGPGGCDADGIKDEPFLTEIASHGYVVIANDEPNGEGKAWGEAMPASLDWITAPERAADPRFQTVNTDRIAAAGHSCGALQMYMLRNDTRVGFFGAFNAGLLREDIPQLPAIIKEDPSVIAEVHKPTFYFLGGPNDKAYVAGMGDYANLPQGVPKWVGNLPVGHSGTFNEPNGGKYSEAAVNWLDWTLRENEAAGGFFDCGGAEAAGWGEIASQDLDNVLDYRP